MLRRPGYDDEWHAPEHLTVEVASALRGRWLGGKLTDEGFIAGLQRLADAVVFLHPVRELLPRMAELSGNVTVYDAAYLALAEALALPLLTLDERLTRVPGVQCRFVGFG